jgi:hypothetical protein
MCYKTYQNLGSLKVHQLVHRGEHP